MIYGSQPLGGAFKPIRQVLFLRICVFIAALVIALFTVFNLFDRNDIGYAIVVQYPNGGVRIVTEPAIFFQGFGKLTQYKTANDTVAFSKDPKEGDPGDASIPVRFRDGGQGKE